MAVDPAPFLVGTISETAAWILAAGCLAYAIGTAYYTNRAFRLGLEDRWSAATATLLMFGLSGFFIRYGPEALPAPFSVWAVGFLIFGVVFTVTWTAGRYQQRVDAFTKEFGQRFNHILENTLPYDQIEVVHRIQERWKQNTEGRRKAPHLAMGIGVATYLAVGFLVLRGIWQALYGGAGESSGGEGIDNLYWASHADGGLYLVGGHVFTITWMLCLLFLLVPAEMLRLRYPELAYPFKPIIVSRLRDKEADLFGAHYYITAAVPACALWLGRDSSQWDTMIPAVVAMLAVTVFADTASALVGRRFGRTHLPHNADKTWAGTVGGTLVAFAVAYPFVGLAAGALAGGVFLLVDVLGPKPIPVSDNLLNPVALTIAFTLAPGLIDPAIPYY